MCILCRLMFKVEMVFINSISIIIWLIGKYIDYIKVYVLNCFYYCVWLGGW